MSARAAALFCAAGFLGGSMLAVQLVDAGDSDPGHYTVEGADTWESIATAHGLTADALQAANNVQRTSVSSHPLTGRIIHIPEVTPSTSTSSISSTVAPTSTTTSTTSAPPTFPSTTEPVSSTTAPPSTTTTTTPSPTTSPTTGVAFSASFSDPQEFYAKFDHDWAGEVQAGKLNGDAVNDWHGDHDMTCGDPNATSRTIHVTPPAGEPGTSSGVKDVSQVFYPCLPGGDPAKGHLMTSVNTSGYVTVWFAPKQTFRDVTRVCWDVNLTDPVGSKWIVVNFLTPAEYQGQTDLGYTTPEFPSGGASSPQGAARFGISTFNGFRSYSDGVFHGGPGNPGGITDKAARYQHCVRDNGNGTLTLTQARPGGVVASSTVQGQIPDGDIRVEFGDDNYNPDKHQDPPIVHNTGPEYTWHWDNIIVEV